MPLSTLINTDLYCIWMAVFKAFEIPDILQCDFCSLSSQTIAFLGIIILSVVEVDFIFGLFSLMRAYSIFRENDLDYEKSLTINRSLTAKNALLQFFVKQSFHVLVNCASRLNICYCKGTSSCWRGFINSGTILIMCHAPFLSSILITYYYAAIYCWSSHSAT